MNRKETLLQILKAYEHGAYITIALLPVKSQRVAQSNIRKYGPITEAYVKNQQTIYVHESENIRVIQPLNRVIRNPRTDKESDIRSNMRKNMMLSYKGKAQFVIIYPPLGHNEEAKQLLKPFGKVQRKRGMNGERHFVVDNLENQIKVMAYIK